jgi:hypothetical protein
MYFNLEWDEDVEGWLLAIPRSRRTRAIKALLRAGLSSYAAARYPGVTPLPPTRCERYSATADAGAPECTGLLQPPRRPVALHARRVPSRRRDTDPTPGAESIDARVAAGAKPDRLLRSYG